MIDKLLKFLLATLQLLGDFVFCLTGTAAAFLKERSVLHLPDGGGRSHVSLSSLSAKAARKLAHSEKC